ncbi:MAG: GNAT family N-acetyltransferase [Acidimicrobiales bacterium]
MTSRPEVTWRPEVTFTPADPLAPPAAGLLAAMEAEMLALYGIGACGIDEPAVAPAGGGPGADASARPRVHIGVPLERSELAPPGGVYLVGRTVTGEVVAGGGLRTIAPGIGEIKRMYVVPALRGGGLGRRLLAALEAWARDELHLERTRLDTGPGQPGARSLYERSGYRGIGNYNANAHASFWGEKSLR